MYVEVLVELKTAKINKTFTYKVPRELESNIMIGKRVIVPFGSQKLEGFIINIKSNIEENYNIKDIISIVDLYPVLNNEMMRLGNYLSNKTLCNLITCYQTMLPTALKAKYKDNTKIKYVSYIKLVDNNFVCKNDSQKKIIELLKKCDQKKSDLIKISLSSLNTMRAKGIIEEYLIEDYRIKIEDNIKEEDIKLTKEQEIVFNECKNNLNTFKPYLLYGVTGSGKTEVYMQLISLVIKNNKEALVLVPEISLTPLFVDKFKSRFGSKIAILHSGLSNGEKYDEWRKIQNKEVSIVIGARSAAFAPLTNIGIIILDEEHSDSYKQENNPKYDTHDVLLYRAKTHNCPIIFGSATPQIESFTRAKLGIYTLLEMPNRVNNNMPKVTLVDMKDEIKKGNKIISSNLKEELINTLNRNEQAIILLNRRGYTTIMTCHDCGYKELCPNCDIPLTYHKHNNILKCHYCDYKTSVKLKCPECGGNNIDTFGLGTEKLEEELSKISPLCKIIRMDQDTTTKKGSHNRIIEDFKDEKYNVLVGTQMISKGLDFKNVTLVGVINGDQTLNIPDFRSSERTFNLLNQVAGRSGRSDKSGKVIIQGFNLDHYSIKYASLHDYIDFYEEEMKIRKKLKYPPFVNLSVIKIIGNNYDNCMLHANKISNYLHTIKVPNLVVLGPSLCSIPKFNNKYYLQIILKYKNLNDIIENIKFIKEKYLQNKEITIDIDLSPIKL